jgi:phosphodiesterase/alkaline phosphatase D-like protein
MLSFRARGLPRLSAFLLLSACVVAQLPNRVAAGDVGPHFATLWARATVAGPVTFQLTLDPNFAVGLQTKTVVVADALVPAKATYYPLLPARQYHYRVLDAAGVADVGKFRTLRAPTSDGDVRFGVSGDSRGELAPYYGVTNVASRDVDFFVCLGDTIYADVQSPALPGVAQATTLAQYRTKHSEVLSAAAGLNALGDLRASTAVFATIDDHEVINDFSGGAYPSSDLRFDQVGQFINDTQLYKNGLRAFVDYHPINVNASWYGQTGDARTALKRKLYRYRRLGSRAAMFLLDNRSFRDAPLADVLNPQDPAQVGAFLAGSFNPARTMLGQKQLDDLKADLLDAHLAGVTWKFVMVPEPFQNLGVVAASDRFEGYAAERTAIMAHVQQFGISNVVFVAADIHGTLVNNITYQNFPGGPQILTGAFEITTGPIAYAAPFGPTVVGLAAALGLLSPPQVAFYASLPTPAKDAFVEGLVNGQLAPFGYDLVGLQGSPVAATLLQGGYVATHVYGWTEFDVRGDDGLLTVTTYGVDPAAAGAAPAVVSQFEVVPQ